MEQHTARFVPHSLQRMTVSLDGHHLFTHDVVTNRAYEEQPTNHTPAGLLLTRSMIEAWLAPHFDVFMAALAAEEIYARCNTVHNIHMLIDEDQAHYSVIHSMSGPCSPNPIGSVWTS